MDPNIPTKGFFTQLKDLAPERLGRVREERVHVTRELEVRLRTAHLEDAAALGASRAAANIAIKKIVRRVPRGVAVCDWRLMVGTSL